MTRRCLRRAAAAALPVGVAVVDGIVVNGPAPGPGLWVALGAAAALLLRTRLPELALVAGLPGLYLGYIAFAPLIALYCLADRRRSSVVAGAGAVVVALAQFLHYPVDGATELALDRETLLAALDSCVLGAGSVLLGRSARLRRDRLREVTESREREHRLLAERTLATERARLAREMHDVVAHKVGLIGLQAGALEVSGPDAAAVREGAGVIRELSVRTITELQHMVGVLRAAGGAGAELAPQPCLADIPALTRDSGLQVSLDAPGAADGWPEAVERAAYRTVQEALTNVSKHAPGAEVHVRIRPVDGGLRVEIRNTPSDGSCAPVDLPGGGHGLVGLRERAQLLGGTFRSGAVHGGGFLVRADFPV
ncbi:sensor histidine kinase [Streptomyces xanthophaeus]|uniref:sensor histidine kinase n=1 Tax=Streptomyces xanthophaeus TaxID=67385 RepID=UPI00233E7B2A|nr:histidine kinase [Streptomyces xanthophaeus]WCD87189.1 Signal transduction histidine-protein kinase/phosphatase UhpB [Streptomyces xanthophaeus]